MAFEIVPAALAVKSMRDNGYKNAAYALAELLDNSIQAEATSVELLIGERFFYGDRLKSTLENIAILDNGAGMNPDTLQISLQFGNGTHLDSSTQNGIGKFGMGLPAASISQCKKVEVWSWQNGSENVFYTYLDITEIENKVMTEVPKPIKNKIPTIWKEQSDSIGNSGTLIVWSKIDRCHWKKGNTIINHSESLVGRIYRKFLEDERVKIRMVTFDVEGEQKTQERYARHNDPMYLMENSSCPEPWGKEAMFERWGVKDSIHSIKFRGKKHEVIIRYSTVKKSARLIPNPGDKPYGKHAAKNLGVSIMRADREITLDQNWAIQYEPTERWWGVEVEFPPALDEIFGLTNNKQSASFFESLAQLNLDELIGSGSFTQFKLELELNEDPTSSLIDIATEIRKNIRSMRTHLKDQTRGNRSKNKRTQSISPEAKATDATNELKKKGHKGKSDKGEKDDLNERKGKLQDYLFESGHDKADSKSIANDLIQSNTKYFFDTKSVESSSFFTVQNKAGVIIINLNRDHPAYSQLIELLEKEIIGTESSEELVDRLQKARNGLFLLIAAWARYEDEEGNESKLDQLKDTRSDWGVYARKFLRGML